MPCMGPQDTSPEGRLWSSPESISHPPGDPVGDVAQTLLLRPRTGSKIIAGGRSENKGDHV